MDFKKLRTFQCAAQTLNFSEASNQLGYVQSAVTNQIKALESELNTQLFERNGRGVKLTASGERLLHYTHKLLAIKEEARSAVSQSKDSKPIKIGGHETIITYYLPQLLEAYSKQNPTARYMIQATPVAQLKNDVVSSSLDMAFILEKPFTRQGLAIHTYQKEEILVVCSPEHPLAQKPRLTMGDLKDHHLLLTEKGCCYRHQLEQRLIEAGVLEPSNISEFVSIETIKQCAKLNVGIAALSAASVKKELEKNELVALHIEELELSSNIHCVFNTNNGVPAEISAFIEFCTKYQFA